MRQRKRTTQPKHIVALITIIAALVTSGAAIAGAPAEKPEPAAISPPATYAGRLTEEKPQSVALEFGEDAVFYYDIPLAHELQDFVRAEAEKMGVPPELILAIMDQESDYRANVISASNDYGIMQINKINHESLREILGVTDFLDPEQNIRCGTYMIGKLLAKYDGDMHRALTAYNRGEGGANKYYSNNGTYETTYSRSIIEIYNNLKEERGNAA